MCSTHNTHLFTFSWLRLLTWSSSIRSRPWVCDSWQKRYFTGKQRRIWNVLQGRVIVWIDGLFWIFHLQKSRHWKYLLCFNIDFLLYFGCAVSDLESEHDDKSSLFLEIKLNPQHKQRGKSRQKVIVEEIQSRVIKFCLAKLPHPTQATSRSPLQVGLNIWLYWAWL